MHILSTLRGSLSIGIHPLFYCAAFTAPPVAAVACGARGLARVAACRGAHALASPSWLSHGARACLCGGLACAAGLAAADGAKFHQFKSFSPPESAPSAPILVNALKIHANPWRTRKNECANTEMSAPISAPITDKTPLARRERRRSSGRAEGMARSRGRRADAIFNCFHASQHVRRCDFQLLSCKPACAPMRSLRSSMASSRARRGVRRAWRRRAGAKFRQFKSFSPPESAPSAPILVNALKIHANPWRTRKNECANTEMSAPISAPITDKTPLARRERRRSSGRAEGPRRGDGALSRPLAPMRIQMAFMQARMCAERKAARGQAMSGRPLSP